MSLTHMEHIDDMLLDKTPETHAFFSMLLYSITSANLSIKFDGAPSIVFGADSEKKFFIGTKSVFNKTPKMIYSKEDVDALYPEGRLNSVLRTLFDVLKEYPRQFPVYQGDLLFIDDNISDSFTPNVVTYTARGSSGYKVGFIPHTIYPTDEDFKSGTFSGISYTPRSTEHIFIPTLHVRYFFGNKILLAKIVHAIDKFRKEMAIAVELIPLIKKYKNHCIKSDKPYNTNDFIQYLKHSLTDDILTVSQPTSISSKARRLVYVMDCLRYAAEQRAVTAYFNICELIGKWVSSIDAYNDDCIPDIGGIKKHEGYVIEAKLGLYVKLVDRRNFSRVNFAKNGSKFNERNQMQV